MKIRINHGKLDQRGMVSIIVTMVLIIVMTLVVLAMSRNSITEQRQALDRQLSDQAFYNAESGISDWTNHLNNNPDLPLEKTNCDNSGFSGAPSQQVGTDPENTYSCLLYDKAPNSIIFGNLTPGDGKTMPITPNINLKKMVIKWSSPSDNGTVTSGCNLTTGSLLPVNLPANCNVAVLKVDLIDPGVANRDALINNSFTSYFLPGSGPANSTVQFSAGRGVTGQGVTAVPQCVDGVGCTMNIDMDTFTGLGLPAGDTLYLHIKTYYHGNDIEITGFNNLNQPVRFVNSQILIDATGKAKDVLRRVQVRVGANYEFPPIDYSLRSADSICKLITVDKDASPATATIQSQCL